MKINFLQHLGREFRGPVQGFLRRTAAVTALTSAAVLTAPAMPSVQTLTGGPWQGNPLYYGYTDGYTVSEAQFHTPYAMVLDITGDNMFVADRDNNAVRYLSGISAASGQTYTFVTEGLNQPIGLALDGEANLYVLNRGNGRDGRVLKYDVYGDLVETNVMALTNACGMVRDYLGNIYLTVESNKVIRVSPAGVKSTVATITSAGASLRGIAIKPDGKLAVCDSGRHGIYVVDPATGIVTTNAGFHGAGDFTTQNNISSPSTARFNQPYGVAAAGDGSLIVTDFGNDRVKIVLSNGAVTNLYGVSSNLWYNGPGSYPGWWDGTVGVPDALGGVEARAPIGVLLAPDSTVFVTESYYHLIRKVTNTRLPPPPPPPPLAPTIFSVTTNYNLVTLAWTESTAATNYFVKRSPSSGGPYTTIASVQGTGFNDTTVINGSTYYYVISASNQGGESPNSTEVSARPPLPPVPDPQIGYVDFPPTGAPYPFTSLFHPSSSVVLNNDAYIVIVGSFGSQTFYTFGDPNAGEIPNPTSSSSSAHAGYTDGLSEQTVRANYSVAPIRPDLIIKAVGKKNDGSPDSAIVQSRFQFVAGNPVINGNNAALFFISDITANARLYYTIDGSDPSPTNRSAVDLGTVNTPTDVWSVSLGVQSNLLFKVRAYRDNYQPSAIVSNLFSGTNYDANKLTFGFLSGEVSSSFVTSPGQLFYAPVTLSVLPDTKIYSLQFNITATNLAGAPPLSGEFRFQSMLEKPDKDNPGLFLKIPPAMFVNYTITTNYDYNSDKFVTNYIPNYTNLLFTSQNLLGVGWVERFSQTNLYDTKAQDLITYSQAHDTMFLGADGKVILGGYGVRIPGNAVAGDQYRIRLGNPSATADGIGTPGSLVYIDTPTNGSLTVGQINAVKDITIGQLKYVVGDCAPFSWFNAGDFGNSNLFSDDVLQVFQSATYGLNNPPEGSDFFDSMDSCCGIYAPAPGTDYLLPSGASAAQDPLFDENDTTINSVAFGDGVLDVTDIFVTFRRSLDPSLQWFQRFWTNGVRAAQTYPTPLIAAAPVLKAAARTVAPEVQFTAGDGIAAAGQTVMVPIEAHIHGDYPLRLLALGITVEPLEGSPPIAAQIQFLPNPALGAPTISNAKGKGNFAGAWLNNTITGLTGDATVGTLQITLPANSTSDSAYAIHFDHASASPNGLASFERRARQGLITLRDRSASSFGDGIPDSWRLRHFGGVNNLLSQASADADGDGVNNKQEYQAGTDPNDAASLLKLKTGKGLSAAISVRWPSVANKQYIIERAASIYAPVWAPVSTNNGTGWDMEFQDNSPGTGPRFYRVRVQ